MLDSVRDTAIEIADDFLGTTDVEGLPIEIGYEGQDSPPIAIENSEGQEILLLNLDAIEESKEEQILSSASSQVWSQQGGLVDSQLIEDVLLVSEGVTTQDIRSTTSYFEDYLPDREVDLLRRCLYLRIEWVDDTSYTDSRQMTDRKASLRREYGDKATAVANLASSGYYDEQGYLRVVFEKVKNDGSISRGEYISIYDELIRDQPFCVFVSGKSNIPEIKKEILSKNGTLSAYQIEIDFIDVRAQGGNNRGKLEQSILEIQRDAYTMHFEVRVMPRETSCRIYNIDN
ncbi:hypothetical protein [Halococcus thailandensis]|uniref:hypothetical protein n=1 Tax=Halococcus thailandensis TaxID=335952 RepID=UPI0012680D6D|nr:hypothetical protein [Halococcus thailandensis]